MPGRSSAPQDTGALAVGSAIALAEALGTGLRARGLMLATAESCTGGLIGATITAVAGSSDYYVGGVVCYANSAKSRVLGVAAATLARHGAVSEETARQMAEGARDLLGADIAVSTTGIAGPGGGTEAKPVGLVFLSVADRRGSVVERHVFEGSRDEVRARAVEAALRAVLATLGQTGAA